jgi:hypothetical protein
MTTRPYLYRLVISTVHQAYFLLGFFAINQDIIESTEGRIYLKIHLLMRGYQLIPFEEKCEKRAEKRGQCR